MKKISIFSKLSRRKIKNIEMCSFELFDLLLYYPLREGKENNEMGSIDDNVTGGFSGSSIQGPRIGSSGSEA
jgi:hypothetical protein